MPITACTVAVLALWLTALSVHVSRLRLRYRLSFGDGGHKDLLAATRAHGNGLEQSLLFVLLLGSLESLAGGHPALMKVAAASFVITRVLHATALFTRRLAFRQCAHVVTLALQLVLSVCILVQVGGLT